MTIFTEYFVTCDGPHPDDPEAECEAQFTYTVADGRLADADGLARQMRQRGWRHVGIDSDGHVFCPLHRKVPT